jgi:hypothetical protein
VLKQIAAPLQVKNRTIMDVDHLKGLCLAHPVIEHGQFTIDLLIASDCYWEFVQDVVVRPPTDKGPVAMKTKLGYVLSGPVNSSGRVDSNCVSEHAKNNTSVPPSVHVAMSLVSLDTSGTSDAEEFDLQRFWEIESLGIYTEEIPIKHSEVEFRLRYQSTMLEIKDGQFQARLPWKEEFPELPTNYQVADRRTRAMVSKLDDKQLEMYDNIIQEQLQRDFIEPVDEDILCPHRIHYIPHRGVAKDSVTTPLRLVYDCSARQSRDSASLNDCLYSTPPVYNSILTILQHFRSHNHGVIADIEKAFLNIKLHPDDRDVTRFF